MRSVIDIAESVRAGQETAVSVLETFIARIERGNPRLNAFVHLDFELALTAAQAVDLKVARGEDPGPLAGVPIGVKDMEDCTGMPTRNGTLLIGDETPKPADSIQVARLRAAA